MADDELDIPPECYEIKDWFYERTGAALVKEIKSFIAKTGTPHLWRGHTHIKPPPDSIPEYLDEFDLPDKLIRGKHFAPCPCCTPRHPKFGLNGKIGWFPDEGVIRLLGPDCFATLNKEAHETAKEDLRKRKQRARDTRYLLGNQPRLLSALANLRQALLVAEAIVSFANELQYVLVENLDLPLWSEVHSGYLKVWEEFSDLSGRTGQVRRLSREVDYAPVCGFHMLDPHLKNYPFQIEQNIDGLEIVERADWAAKLDEMSDIDRNKLARVISNTIKKSRGLLEEMGELQQFVSPVNVATIRTWGNKPPAAASCFARRLATLASVFVGAMPIETGIPVHCSTVRRSSRACASSRCSKPARLRKASSIE